MLTDDRRERAAQYPALPNWSTFLSYCKTASVCLALALESGCGAPISREGQSKPPPKVSGRLADVDDWVGQEWRLPKLAQKRDEWVRAFTVALRRAAESKGQNNLVVYPGVSLELGNGMQPYVLVNYDHFLELAGTRPARVGLQTLVEVHFNRDGLPEHIVITTQDPGLYSHCIQSPVDQNDRPALALLVYESRAAEIELFERHSR